MFLPNIETERLVQRMYQPEELETVYRMLADKDVTRFFPPDFSITREYVLSGMPRRLKRWQGQGFGQLGVFEKESEKLTGYSGLQYFDNTPEIEIYYGFFKEFWGKGYATEAAKAMLRFGFEEVKLEMISAGTHPENLPSQKVLSKIGLTKHPELKRFYNIDSVYFSILRKDYQPDESAGYLLSHTEINV
jgi:RimJ/RimL family protein N-acetyltransferase